MRTFAGVLQHVRTKWLAHEICLPASDVSSGKIGMGLCKKQLQAQSPASHIVSLPHGCQISRWVTLFQNWDRQLEGEGHDERQWPVKTGSAWCLM